MAIFPGAVSTDADLYIAVNNQSTLLTDNPLTVGAITVNVLSTTGFPTVGTISIDAEIIHYTGITATSFTGCTRGFDGTTAASHLLNAQVDHNVVAVHHNVVKDEIKAIEQNLSDRIGLGSTTLKGVDGTAALPTYTFASDPDTGIYRSGLNRLDFSAGGGQRLSIAIDEIQAFHPYRTIDGTLALPAYSFSSDPDSGIYRVGANSLGMVVGGAVATLFDTAGENFYASGTEIVNVRTQGIRLIDGTVSLPAYSFISDTDTGLYRDSANSFNAVASAGIVMNWNPTSVIARQTIQGINGTASVPTFSFENDANTGIYRITTDTLGFSTNGVERFRMDTAALTAALPLAMGTNKITGLGNATAAQDAVAYIQNKILQVQYATTTTPTTTTSTSFVSTNLEVTITPSSTSSLILVFAFGNLSHSANGFSGIAGLARGTTDITSTNGQADVNITATGFGGAVVPCSLMVRDNPATTSATTYRVRIKTMSGSGQTGWINGNAQFGSIVAVEINGL